MMPAFEPRTKIVRFVTADFAVSLKSLLIVAVSACSFLHVFRTSVLAQLLLAPVCASAAQAKPEIQYIICEPGLAFLHLRLDVVNEILLFV